jgi:hypothetical protein
MAAVSDAVTPLRRPKRSLKKRKERPAKSNGRHDDDDEDGAEAEPEPRAKEPRRASLPTSNKNAPRLRGGAGPVENGAEIKLEDIGSEATYDLVRLRVSG